ncbi:DapH/DapD/GlmU-related protein [Bacteroides sp.]|uniref:acyltransferase n=1 Tax=Bacteroides sp. TaxID=29523 RepID=UPI00263910F1|nr:acyltransferase [Bacteroides sp.]MDD3038760.1 acyltransferase [Bacteroides sp.]
MKKLIKKAIKQFLGIPVHLSLKELLVKHDIKGDIDSANGNFCYINNKGSIKVASNVQFISEPNGSIFKVALSTYLPDSELFIGSNCKLHGVVIHCNEKITIGNNCLLGPGVILCDNNSHRVSVNYEERMKSPASAPIVLEDNVWIGMNSIVLKGVTIGENSIVAAGSVITKNLPANGLYGGNPAKFIKVIDSID